MKMQMKRIEVTDHGYIMIGLAIMGIVLTGLIILSASLL